MFRVIKFELFGQNQENKKTNWKTHEILSARSITKITTSGNQYWMLTQSALLITMYLRGKQQISFFSVSSREKVSLNSNVLDQTVLQCYSSQTQKVTEEAAKEKININPFYFSLNSFNLYTEDIKVTETKERKRYLISLFVLLIFCQVQSYCRFLGFLKKLKSLFFFGIISWYSWKDWGSK